MPEYEGVIILAHSMGGLIATDTFIKLFELKKTLQPSKVMGQNAKGPKEDSEEKHHFCIAEADVDPQVLEKNNHSSSTPVDAPQESSWYSSILNTFWSSSSGASKDVPEKVIVADQDTLNSFPVDQESVHSDKDPLENQSNQNTVLGETRVNIIAIICFDTPFFGLESTVFTKGATDYSADFVSSYAPAQHQETINSGIKYGNALAIETIKQIPQVTYSAASGFLLPLTNPRRAAHIVKDGIVAGVTNTPQTLASAASVAGAAASSISNVISFSVTSLYTTTTKQDEQPSDTNKSETRAEQEIEPTEKKKENQVSTQPTTTVPQTISSVVSVAGAAASSISNVISFSVTSLYTTTTKQDDSKPEKENKDPKVEEDKVVQQDTSDNEPNDVVIEKAVAVIEKEDAVIEKDDSAIENNDVVNRAELLPIPRDSNLSTWVSVGLTAAGLGLGVYYTGGLLAAGSISTLARGAALAYGIPAADEGRKYLQFLYPIWAESQQSLEDRVQFLLDQSANGSFFARCYYISIQVDATSGSSQETETPKRSRTFIKPPLEFSKSLFRKIGSDMSNEIGGHMRMFSREENPGQYWELIHLVGKDLKYVISHSRDAGFLKD